MSHAPANRLTAAAAAPLCCLAAGCTVGPEFKPPQMRMPEAYRFSGKSGAEAASFKWWELFDDPALAALVNTALRENRDIRKALSRIEESRAMLRFVGADRFPAADLRGNAGRANFAGGTILPATANTGFITPAVSWELDFWGRFAKATEAARAEFAATEYAVRSARISLVSDVASRYFSLLDFRHRLSITEKTLESREETLRIIRKKFDAGLVSELDLSQARVQREIAAAAIPENRRLIALAENALSALLGRFPGEIKTGAYGRVRWAVPEIPVGLPSELLERRPDILQAMYRLKADNARIGVARAARLPAFRLNASAGAAVNETGGVRTDGFVWSLGGAVLSPIFNFGKNRARVEIEKERARQAESEYEDTVLNAVREVSDSLSEIETYRKQLLSLEKRTEAARKANDISKLRYESGVTSYLEVLETERQLFDVQFALSAATREYRNSYVRLYKALGGGWTTEGAADGPQTRGAGGKR